MRYLLGGLAASVVLLFAGSVLFSSSTTHTVTKTKTIRVSKPENIYIVNRAQKYISDAEIERDIPAWEHALNVDFARYWHTAKYKLIFLGRKTPPRDQITAIFQSKGPVDGALAYHWVERNSAPSITVYAGTGVYYGYDNSVSMTHELFELAADPLTSDVSQGWPAASYYIEDAALNIYAFSQHGFLGWFQETADPVEADSYCSPGLDGKCVHISDFVTPAWFNQGVGSKFDFMGLCQQPFWIRPGGYAQYEDLEGWHMIENFRKGHPSDRGFSKGDPDPAEKT